MAEEASTEARLRQWFHGPVGRLVSAAEHSLMQEIMPDLFGFHALQIGRVDDADLLGSSRACHRAVIAPESSPEGNGHAAMVCSPQALAIAADSVDVVVLAHVIEFESDPYQVLREADRVLVGEGHVVILAFNPLSLWGLARAGLAWRDQPPWCGRFVSRSRLKDWLQVLGFEIVATRHACYRPPVPNERLGDRLEFMEKLGAYWWPPLGGVSCIVGRKRLIPLTPLRMRWRDSRRLVPGVVEPTARLACRRNQR